MKMMGSRAHTVEILYSFHSSVSVSIVIPTKSQLIRLPRILDQKILVKLMIPVRRANIDDSMLLGISLAIMVCDGMATRIAYIWPNVTSVKVRYQNGASGLKVPFKRSRTMRLAMKLINMAIRRTHLSSMVVKAQK